MLAKEFITRCSLLKLNLQVPYKVVNNLSLFCFRQPCGWTRTHTISYQRIQTVI